jgi:hypothetical protein
MTAAPAQAQELCGGTSYPFPYTDVASVGAVFCPGIMQAYVTGVSKGTTPTTFSPNETVTRVQMTTFLQRSLDQGLTRASRRAAVNQWAVPQNINAMQTIAVGGRPVFCAADGESVWTPTYFGDEVVQVQASTGKLLGTWTGATFGEGILVAAGKVYVTDAGTSKLYMVDPTQAPGAVTIAATGLGGEPFAMAFDGTNIWTTNLLGESVSIITPQPTTPYSVTTVSTGFTSPNGILFDGANIWVTDQGSGSAGSLFKLDAMGNIIQTVAVGDQPQLPGFDGTNIWVPNGGTQSNSITIVQAKTGNVVATINADATNLLNSPYAASFDGERMMVVNAGGGSIVSLFKAADLSFIATVTTGGAPSAACSDGINFWVPLFNTGNLVRF